MSPAKLVLALFGDGMLLASISLRRHRQQIAMLGLELRLEVGLDPLSLRHDGVLHEFVLIPEVQVLLVQPCGLLPQEVADLADLAVHLWVGSHAQGGTMRDLAKLWVLGVCVDGVVALGGRKRDLVLLDHSIELLGILG